MLEGQFGSLGNFIKKRYKIIIIVWLVALLVLLPFAAESTSLVNYNIENVEFAGSNQTMSAEAKTLLNNQFNSSNSSSNGTAVVLYIASPLENVTSYKLWERLNSTYKSDLNSLAPSGIISPYDIGNGVVNSISNSTYTVYTDVSKAANGSISGYNTFNSSVNSVENFTIELISIDSYFNSTHYNISLAVQSYSTLFKSYEDTINNTSQLLYGIPLAYYTIYNNKSLAAYPTPQRDYFASETLLNETKNFGNSSLSVGYYQAFYNTWNNTSNPYYNGSDYSRLNFSIQQAYTVLNNSLNQTESEIFYPIHSSFNITSYSNNATRENITLNLVYSLTSSYGAGDVYIFEATYNNFRSRGNETLLSQNLTGQILNSSDPQIAIFTNQTFNMSPVQFAGYFNAVNSLNNSFFEMQLNQSLLSASLKQLYQSVDIPSNVFYSSLIENKLATYTPYFINYTASELNALSSSLGVSSQTVVSDFLAEGSKNSSLNLTEQFLKNQFEGYPYFTFNNPAKFVSESVSTGGTLADSLSGNYTKAGISLSAPLFHSLVPNNFSGYMVVLEFNQSNLNNSQLNTLTNYLSGIQQEFDPVKIYSTSSAQISSGIESTAYSGLIFSLVAGIIASVIIVGIYFRSPLLAFVPLMFFGVSMIIILGLSYLIFGILLKTPLSFIVTTLSAMLILGLSTDYSVYMLNRYSKEKSDDKLGTTVKWAGHAVFTSGLTVILSYIVLGIFKVPIIGSGGFVNALGITVSLAVALTLLPAFMIVFKKRIKPRKIIVNFEKVARVSRKHKKVLVAVLIVIFISTLVVYEATPTSFSLFSLIPNNTGKTGYYEMTSAFGGDTLSPSYALLTFPSQIYLNGHFNETDIGILNNVTTALLKDSGISDLTTLTYPFGTFVNVSNIVGSTLSKNTILNQSLTFVGKDGKTVLLNFTTKSVSYISSGIDSIARVDAVMKQVVPAGVSYKVGGTAQSLLDSSNAINISTYEIVLILSVMIFAVLAFQLSSIFTPLRLLFNVGTSALLAVSLFYLVYHYLLKLPLIVFGPLFVIVTLFGVGLDYDIFLVTKAREAVISGKSDEAAISEAIDENGSVVLVLGFILAGVFGSLIFSSIGIISEIGFAVTAGVLIDTLISWLFLIPALMLVLKKYNWWPSHIRPDH
jgi:Predicted drug exporters of the RND superfamily